MSSSTWPWILVTKERHYVFGLFISSPHPAHNDSLNNPNDNTSSNIKNMMSAKEDPADTNSSSPGKQRKPEYEIDGSNDDEDDGQHDGPGGVTRGEAELVQS